MELEWAKRLPEAWRLLRISWRPARIIGVAVICAAVCVLFSLLGASIVYVDAASGSYAFNLKEYFRALFVVSLVLQGIVWLVGAPALVGASVTTEYLTNTWIFQSTTPQPAGKLLLGKLIGSPGDVYTGSIVMLPFLLITAGMIRFPFVYLIKIIIVMLFSAVFFCSLFLLISCITEKQKNTSAAISFLMFFVLFVSWTAVVDSRLELNGTIGMLHPIVISQWLIEDFFSPRRGESVEWFISFYGMRLPPVLFSAFFYLSWAGCFFACAEAHIRRKTGFLVNRLPLLLMMLFIDFFIMGFQDKLNTDIFSFTLLVAVNTIFFYSVIFLHTQPLRETKPWIYRKGTDRWNFLHYFESDAPSVYIIAALIPFHIAVMYYQWRSCGMADSVNVCGGPQKGIFYLYPLLFIPIIIRDTLLLQFCRFTWKRGIVVFLLIYSIGFVGFTTLTAIASDAGFPLIDLTPFTTFYEIFTATTGMSEGYYPLTISANTILALAAWILFYRPVKKAGEKLKEQL